MVGEQRLERYWREYEDYQSRIVIAAVDGQPAGTTRLTDEELTVIVGVATVTALRGRGVATAITATLAREALAEREACTLYVERHSQAARIYNRLGFVPLFRTRAWLRPYRADQQIPA